MSVIIEGRDFQNSPAMKYWTPNKARGTDIKKEMVQMIYSQDFILAEKIDGNFLMIGKTLEGEVFTRSRNATVNGDFPNKIGHIPHLKTSFENLPNGTIFLGEIYLPSNQQSRAVTTIFNCLESKAIARQNKGEKLNFYIFDCLAYDGKDISQYRLIDRIQYAKIGFSLFLLDNPCIHMAKYIEEPELMEDYIACVLEKGGEGVVIQRKDNPYEWGKRTAHHSLKVKKEIGTEIDAFLTGQYMPATVEYTGDKKIEDWPYWLNLKTNEKMFGNHFIEFNAGAPYTPITKGCFYNWAGSVQFGVYRDGEIVPIGWISNVTEEVKNGIINEPEKWCKKVAKISAMQIEEDTKHLRHAKVMEWRNDGDKRWDECDGKEIFG